MSNKIGWIVGGVCAVAVIVVLVIVLAFPQPSEPTKATAEPGLLDLKTVSAPVTNVLASEPTGAGNAADDYVAAANDYEQISAEVATASGMAERTGSPLAPATVTKLEAIAAKVSAGTAKARMALVLDHTGGKMRVKSTVKPAEKIVEMANGLVNLYTVYMARKDYARAEKLVRDLFTIGWHMMRERARATVVSQGASLQSSAIALLGDLYREMGPSKADRLAGLAAYDRGLGALLDNYDKKLRICWNQMPEPGDIFKIYEQDQDRAWKVEAMLVMAILKIQQEGHRGNARKIRELTDQGLASNDRYIKAAAESVRNFTRDDFDRVGWPD